MAASVPPKRVLALGAHPDDVELGCGGSLVKFRDAGVETMSAIFSSCSDENPDDSTLRSREVEVAARAIGVSRLFQFDFPNRELPEHRHQVMSTMEELQKDLEPDLLFIPFLDDPHQDHETVARAAIRTFRRRETILQYEIVRYGSHSFTPSLFIDITATLERKVAALRHYKSQLGRRAYFDEESFRSLARTRGAQSGYDYAEGFVVYKMFW
ncbi:MAG TPA: PIG-L deacetylase family protein [Thermoplasmata archaeon]|nr:PIG-L deacetylase family protein [Thermoplasmata archaeon]